MASKRSAIWSAASACGADVDAVRQRHVGALERAGAGAEDGACRRVLGDEGEQPRRHRARLEQAQHRLGHELFGHPRRRRRRQAVDADVVLRALDRERLHQADERHLGGAVVRLAEVAVQARRRCRHDDAAVVLRSHRLPDRLGAVHRAHQVDVDDEPEVVELHLGEALVAQDAGVVDEDVDPAPLGQRRVDHRLHGAEVGDRGAVGDRLAAGGADLLGDGVGGGRRAAAAVERAAQVVDDDRRAARRQRQRVLAAEAAAGAGHDRDASIESNRHVLRFLFQCSEPSAPNVIDAAFRARRGGRSRSCELPPCRRGPAATTRPSGRATWPWRPP